MNKKWNLLSLAGFRVNELHGFLFIFAKDSPIKGFITDTDDIKNIDKHDKIILSESDVNKIIEQDNVFGVLVGGEYFYFAMPVVLKNFLLNQKEDNFTLKDNGILVLAEDEKKKEIFF